MGKYNKELTELKKYQQELLTTIAKEYDISSKALQDLIINSNKFTYENTTAGQRQNDYLGIIKYALNNLSK